MKVAEIVKMLGLDIIGMDNIIYNSLERLMITEFNEIIDMCKGTNSVQSFNYAVESLKRKWDAVALKTTSGIDQAYWVKFIDNIIAPVFKRSFNKDYAYNKHKSPEFEYTKPKDTFEYDNWKMYQELFGIDFNNFFNHFYNEPHIHITPKTIIPSEFISVFKLDAKFCTIDQLKTEYRKLAKKCHPDVGGTKEAFQELNNAYEVCIQYLETKE
jgi:hypothetical protein